MRQGDFTLSELEALGPKLTGRASKTEALSRDDVRGYYGIINKSLNSQISSLYLLPKSQYGKRIERAAEEGRAGAVVTFLAILELVKGQSIRLVQAGPYARIHVKLGSHHEED